MTEQLPAPATHKRHESLRERLFGPRGRHELNERRRSGNRKVGGFGIRLMMNRLRVMGHDMGKHAASPALEAPRHRGRPAIEAAPALPALFPAERRPGVAVTPESGAIDWRKQRGTAQTAVEAPAPNRAVEANAPEVIGSPAWRAEHAAVEAAGDPYVPEASAIRPEIPAEASPQPLDSAAWEAKYSDPGLAAEAFAQDQYFGPDGKPRPLRQEPEQPAGRLITREPGAHYNPAEDISQMPQRTYDAHDIAPHVGRHRAPEPEASGWFAGSNVGRK